MPYFPFYIDIKGKPCLVVGGGQVAHRKIQKLMPFQPEITVVAPKICEEIRGVKGVKCLPRPFCENDLEGKFFVISATDDEQLNCEIFNLCNQRKILVNTVDDKEKCGFIFPATAVRGDISVGISTAGKSPLLASFLRESIENMLTDRYIETAEILGAFRKTVKSEFPNEASRKQAFEAILTLCLESEKMPTAEEINSLIKDMKKSYGN